MDRSTILAVATALGSLILGWVLSELSVAFRGRAARREAGGRALVELLEVRHYMKAITLVAEELRSRTNASEEEFRRGLGWIQSFLPSEPDLHERYKNAVTQIAGPAPLLAFELRRKDQIPRLLAAIKGTQVVPAPDEAIRRRLESGLEASALDALEQSIRRVAWEHGIKTWLRTRQLMRRVPGLPEDYLRILDEISPRRPRGTGPDP